MLVLAFIAWYNPDIWTALFRYILGEPIALPTVSNYCSVNSMRSDPPELQRGAFVENLSLIDISYNF